MAAEAEEEATLFIETRSIVEKFDEGSSSGLLQTDESLLNRKWPL